MTDTTLEAPELAAIQAALRQLRVHARRPGRSRPPRLQARAGALLTTLSRSPPRSRSPRRFGLPDLKLMRLALFEGSWEGSRERSQEVFGQERDDRATTAISDKLSRLVRVRQREHLPDNRVRWATAVPYAVFNLAAVAGVFFFPPRWQDLILCLGLYLVRMFAVGGGLHRYFSHKSYSTSRPFQFLLAVLATTCGQQGPIWWAAQHRHHHRFSDTPEDFHSPTQRGFLWAHQLWAFTARGQRADLATVRDLLKFPELRWLDSHWLVPHLVLAAVLFAAGGLRAVEWGFFVSTVLLWQVSFMVNSLAHLVGRRRFDTPDTSRNSWILALLTLGDGWHNNHHRYPGSMRAGFYWWEVDVTGYVIRALSWVGLVWNIRSPPPQLLALGRRGR